MSGVATAIGVGTTLVGGYMQDKAAGEAADATRAGAAMSAAEQAKALEYQKEVDKLPLQYRNEALTGLRDVFMGNGDAQQAMIGRAMESPLYKNLMGAIPQGQEAVLQNQAMQGGWRSGDAKMNMMDYTTRMNQDALTKAYGHQLEGMQQFTNPSLNTGGIADTYSGIGSTLGQGETGAAQAEQMGEQGKWDAITGAVNTGLSGYNNYIQSKPMATPASFNADYTAQGGVNPNTWVASDIRLKDKIKHISTIDGRNIYEWVWNDVAEKFFGLKGKSRGVMAHELFESDPQAVTVRGGILRVNYAKIGA